MEPRLTLDRIAHATRRAGKMRGAYPALVTTNSEGGGDSRFRVKVKYPWLAEDEESHWARIAVPMAGKGRGTYFLPEAGDQVLVVFEHGDIGRPIIIGMLWSKKQPPPEKNANKKNSVRVIKSRSGHRLIFDDTQGAERVILVDSSKKNKIVLDAAGDSVTVESGSGDIEIKAPAGTVRLHGKSLTLTATRSAKMKGGTMLEVSAGQSLSVSSNGILQVQGPNVKIG